MDFLQAFDKYSFSGQLLEWITLRELAKLDSALCNHAARNIFQGLVEGGSVYCNDAMLTEEQIYWMRRKDVKIHGSPLCRMCYSFYGHTEGLCSWCSMTPEQLLALKESLSIQVPAMDTARFLAEGVHSTVDKSRCAICNRAGNQTTLINKWLCHCDPVVCQSCPVERCPSCGAEKFGLITADEIELLLTKAFSNKSRIKVARSWAERNAYAGRTVDFAQFICDSETINDVIRRTFLSKGKQVEVNHLHAIYSFAVDPWNCMYDFVGTCYRNIQGPRTYRAIMGVRKSDYDTVKIYETSIELR